MHCIGTTYVFVGGGFQGLCDLDPGTGVKEYESQGYDDAYLSRFDASGNLVWVRVWGDCDYDEVFSIDDDANGFVYACGEFGGTIDFDPGTGIYELESNGTMPDPYLMQLKSTGLWY